MPRFTVTYSHPPHLSTQFLDVLSHPPLASVLFLGYFTRHTGPQENWRRRKRNRIRDVLLRRPQTKLRLLIDCTHCRGLKLTSFTNITKCHEMSPHPLPQLKNHFLRAKQTLNNVSLTQRLKQTNTVPLLLKQRADASRSWKRYLTKSNVLLGSFMIPYKAWLFSDNSQWK